MSSINPDQCTFEKIFSAIPEETPVSSLNLLKFNEQAAYPADNGFMACSGREAYDRYLRTIEPRLTAVGGKLIFISDVLATLTAPSTENSWDLVVLVQYPSFAAFKSMAKNVDTEGPVHRRAALADSRTILIKSPCVPGTNDQEP